MKKLLLLFFLFFNLSALLAQELDKAYYEPYNFPQKYESDRFNRNLNLTFAFPILGGHYYNLTLYGDVARIKLAEFMNIHFGLGISGGMRYNKNVLYMVDDQKAYDLNTAYFAKALVGGGITFRLLNPVNLSLRSGFAGGYELYESSSVRPMLTDGEWSKVKYKQNTQFYFRPGYFYNATLFFRIKKTGLNVSHGAYFLATGLEFMNSVGFTFPVSN